MLELVFTSAKSGLIPGRSGFCSVAWTEGMPKNLIGILENLSTYDILYPPNDPRSINNPVSYSYQKIRLGSRDLYVISRIAFAGLDYTGRTNKIAHHIVIENEAELAGLQYGPISACLCEDNFFTSWDGEPRLLPRRHKLISADLSGFMAEHWQSMMNSPEWAGYIADTFMDNADGGKCLYCEYDHESHNGSILMLIAEIVRLMKKKYYNLFTFNTYFSAASNDIGCFFRAATFNCQNLASVKRFKPQELVSLIDMTPLPANIPPTPAVLAARSNIKPEYNEDPQLIIAAASDITIEEIIPETQTIHTERQIIRHEINTENDFQELKYENNEINPRIRLIIFSSCAFLLIILLILGSLLTLKMMSAKKISAQPPKEEVTLTKEDMIFAAVEKNPAEKKQKVQNQVRMPETEVNKVIEDTAKKSAPATPADKKTAAPKPANKKTAAPKPANKSVKQNKSVQYSRDSIRTLSPADGLKIYLGIIDSKKSSFTLPEILRSTQQIDLVISKNWEDDNVKISNSEAFVERINNSPISLKVYPINLTTSQVIPDKSNPEIMTVELFNRELVIKEPSANYSPRKKYIKTLSFRTPAGKFIWHNNWNPKYVKHIPKGYINDFKYRKSPEEMLLKNYIDITNDDFSELKNAIERWNKNIAIHGKSKLSKKDESLLVVSNVNTVWNEYIALRKDLSQNPHAIKFDTVRDNFNKFYRNMTGLSRKDINGPFTEKLLQHSKNIKIEIADLRLSSGMRANENAMNLRGDINSQLKAEKITAKPDKNKIRNLEIQYNKLTNIADLEKYYDILGACLSSRTKTADIIEFLAELFNEKLYAFEDMKLNDEKLSDTDRENIKKWILPEKMREKFLADYVRQEKINKQITAKLTLNAPAQEKIKNEYEQLIKVFMKYAVSPKWAAIAQKNKAFSSDAILGICRELNSKVKRLAKGTK